MSMAVMFPFQSGKESCVRRCLFGKPTSEKQERDFETQESRLFQNDAKRFREEWGLDPVTGETVSNAKCDCTPVDPTKEDIPSFYFKGYPNRIRKPRRVRYDRERPFQSHEYRIFALEKRSTKRKLDFTDGDICNDIFGNSIGQSESRVPSVGDDVENVQNRDLASSLGLTLPATPSCDVTDSPIQLPSSSVDENGLMCSSLGLDIFTPPQRPGSLKQKTMKDFMPLKKARIGLKPPRS